MTARPILRTALKARLAAAALAAATLADSGAETAAETAEEGEGEALCGKITEGRCLVRSFTPSWVLTQLPSAGRALAFPFEFGCLAHARHLLSSPVS